MLAHRGYLLSLLYAGERRQGRLPGVRGGEPVAIIEHADVKRMLLAQKAYAEGGLALVLYSARLLDDELTETSETAREAAGSLLALLTPVTKTWPSEMAQLSLDLAIQIHGGAGYTRDFQVEQLYRDNRLNPIHEGTTGIQAIDLVGRKLRRDSGKSYSSLLSIVLSVVKEANEIPMLKSDAQALGRAWEKISNAVDMLVREPDESNALSNATPFLFAFGHAVVGWLWLDVGRACATALRQEATGADQSYFSGKLRACRYFVEFELPKIEAWLAPVMSKADVASTMQRDEFFGGLT
jgi:hypothetical protein